MHRYMSLDSSVNAALTEQFNEHGYVLVKNLLPDMLLQVAYE